MDAPSALGRKLQRLVGVGPVPVAPKPSPPAPSGTAPTAVTVRRYLPGHMHGRASVASALSARSTDVAALALDPSFAAVELRGALLLDTETTGLSGGAGTLPFLIGLGGFDEMGSLSLEQLFLSRPGEERPMLARLAERLSAASCVVSFNGKSYDWPLLRTRYVMNRMPVPVPPPHLDLLHCARRAYRHRGGGARLTELERAILGHRRVDDIPGHLIPELYFSYLRNRGAGLLHRVLDHNADDLLAVAALLGTLAHSYSTPAAVLDARDALGLAEIALRASEADRAEAFAQLASASSDANVASPALVLRARLRWKVKDVAGAAGHLEDALARGAGAQAAQIHLALAKLYEHRLRDLVRAEHHAAGAAGAEPTPIARRRAERLRRKRQ